MMLNTNSTVARIYRWFYVTNRMPENLCTYFWKLVAMWMLIVPYALVSLPGLIFKDDVDTTGERTVRGLFGWTVITSISSMVWSLSVFWVGVFPQKSFAGTFQTLGALFWFVLVCTVTAYLTVKGLERCRNWLLLREDFRSHPTESRRREPSVIVEWAKAAYHKYCPRISWRD